MTKGYFHDSVRIFFIWNCYFIIIQTGHYVSGSPSEEDMSQILHVILF